jgi:hypothetical protein
MIGGRTKLCGYESYIEGHRGEVQAAILHTFFCELDNEAAVCNNLFSNEKGNRSRDR